MIRGSVPVSVTGPVGLAQLTGEIVKTGFANLLSFAAVISLNLGIVNIFPIRQWTAAELCLCCWNGCAAANAFHPKRREWSTPSDSYC